MGKTSESNTIHCDRFNTIVYDRFNTISRLRHGYKACIIFKHFLNIYTNTILISIPN